VSSAEESITHAIRVDHIMTGRRTGIATFLLAQDLV
jgi:hypothetical protein